MAPTVASWQPMRSSIAIARALAQRGKGIYKLGGGAYFTAADCYAADGNRFPGFCDCSGFVAYTLGYRRGGWNTDAIYADRNRGTRFRLVGQHEAVRPSDVIVKPGPDRDGDGQRDFPGHVGIITGVKAGFVRGAADWYKRLEVTHCSGRGQLTIDPTTGKVYGAVRTTDASGWRSSGAIVRPLHIVWDGPPGPLAGIPKVLGPEAIVAAATLAVGLAAA